MTPKGRGGFLSLLGSSETSGSQLQGAVCYQLVGINIVAAYLAFLTLSLWWGWHIGVLYYNLARMEVWAPHLASAVGVWLEYSGYGLKVFCLLDCLLPGPLAERAGFC